MRFAAEPEGRRWARTLCGLALAFSFQWAAWTMLQGGPWHRATGAVESVTVRIVLPAMRAERPVKRMPVPRTAQAAPAKRRPAAIETAVVDPAETPAQPAAETPSAGPSLETLRADIRRQYVASEGAPQKAGGAALSAADKFSQEVQKAARPNCNDPKYTPKVGIVQFTGLMKLPFLAAGAVSDKGCKW